VRAIGHFVPVALRSILTRLASKIRAVTAMRTAELTGDIPERVAVDVREIVPVCGEYMLWLGKVR
jgi:hypothetical protein